MRIVDCVVSISGIFHFVGYVIASRIGLHKQLFFFVKSRETYHSHTNFDPFFRK